MFSKVILEKVGKRRKRLAILRGVRHIAPAEQFALLQTEVNRADSDGYIFFCEWTPPTGSSNNSLTSPLLTRNGRRLAKLLRSVTEKGYRHHAEKEGLVHQADALQVPQAIHADLSLQEIANLLDKQGARCSWFLLQLYLAALRKPTPLWLNLLVILIGKPLGEWCRKSIAGIFQVGKPILQDHRNGIIFEIIKKKGGDKDIFLIYGDKHIPSLTKLFEKDGWVIRENSISSST